MAGRQTIREWVAEDDAQELLRTLNSALGHLTNRVESMEVLLAPKTQDLMFERPFQEVTVQPGQEAEVYRQTIRKRYVGVVTRMGNDWFPDTSLQRYIDERTMEPTIKRIIAPVTDPMAVKLFARDTVVWRARNNDAIEHTFGVLTDGFLLREDDAERIMAYEV